MKRHIKLGRPKAKASGGSKDQASGRTASRFLAQKQGSKKSGTGAALRRTAGRSSDQNPTDVWRLWELAAMTSSAEAVEAVALGLPLSAIEELRERLEDAEIEALVIPRRTFDYRRAIGMRLSRDESDRALRVARLVKIAGRAFGDAEKGLSWLRDPHPIFRDRPPIALAQTEAGARFVENSLARMEWGAAL